MADAEVDRQLYGKMVESIDADPGKVHPMKGAPLARTRSDLRYWAGIREQHWGYKSGATQGYHKTGSAMDLNYHTNPWMAVRTGGTAGGEAATAGQTKMSIEAIDVIDRAMLWTHGRRAELHIANRPPGGDPVELAAWATEVFKRFNEASDAVASYFALAFDVDREAKLAELTRENDKIVAERDAAPPKKGENTEGQGALLSYKSILSRCRGALTRTRSRGSRARCREDGLGRRTRRWCSDAWGRTSRRSPR